MITLQESNSWLTHSWQRSQAAGLLRDSTPELIKVDRSELQSNQHHARELINACETAALPLFIQAMAHSASRLILADPQGMILGSWGQEHFSKRLVDIALEPGVFWQEQHKGTNAIGTALSEQSLVTILGDQHFLHQNKFLSCTAHPIFDSTGQLVGVIDVTTEQAIHQYDTQLLVRQIAQCIENQLMIESPSAFYQMKVAIDPKLLTSGWQGLVIADSNQKIIACNRTAQRLYPKRSILGSQLSELTGLEDMLNFKGPEFDASNTLYFELTQQRQQNSHVKARPAPIEKPSHSYSRDDNLQRSFEQALCVIDEDIPLLIYGESGVGKEHFVRNLHQQSERANQALVAINCGALSSNLIESELFGYVDGAFTGAKRNGSKGKIRQAQQGILFLDEIGDLPLSAQTRLLRVLQERELSPLGSEQSYPVDIRIVAATHTSLEKLCEQGLFREDLFFRLCGLQLELPALRDRSDLEAMVTDVFNKHSHISQVLEPELKRQLIEYHWPGNIRQLQSLLQTACVLTRHKASLTWQDLPKHQQDLITNQAQNKVSKNHLEDEMSLAIKRCYQQHRGNISQTAKALGIGRSTLYRKIKRFEIKLE
ncbi:sigma-54-dependent Fis family transcriptional regulator [Alginatibacterium sediminis]|nr:sigma-54-dependent Fis family transcriptional regulator [Alginatibacterium sediminis]